MNEYLITKGKDKIRGDPVAVVLQLTTYHLSCAEFVCSPPNATVKDKYSHFYTASNINTHHLFLQ